MLRSAITLCGGVALTVAIAQSGGAQRATAAGDWPMYRHDLAGTGYSPPARLHTTNIAPPTPPPAHKQDECPPADPPLDLQPAKRCDTAVGAWRRTRRTEFRGDADRRRR